MYRPEIKVVDCTIRDGGLMNNWDFDKAMIKDVYEHLSQAGVDYVELGYRADKSMFAPEKHGLWRFCDEEVLREVTANGGGAKISVMCDVGRTDYDTFLPSQDSVVSMYRVATYVKEIDKAIHMAKHLKNLGYEVCINIMAVSHVLEFDLDEALAQLADVDFDTLYIVDSFGYFYSEQIDYLTGKYRAAVPGKELGIHCHNNQQLAFANTVEAIIKGVNYVDGSIFGMGRGAGNCTTELLLGFLKNPKLDIRPVLSLIDKYFTTMQESLKWGYQMPYLTTGILNKHPRTAMAYMDDVIAGTNTKSIVEFYNEHCTDID